MKTIQQQIKLYLGRQTAPPHNNTLGFNATPAITANTTGLTITASISGLTIIAPNSKTTYSGIVIVEGY